MACGTPMVFFKVAGIPDLVRIEDFYQAIVQPFSENLLATSGCGWWV